MSTAFGMAMQGLGDLPPARHEPEGRVSVERIAHEAVGVEAWMHGADHGRDRFGNVRAVAVLQRFGHGSGVRRVLRVDEAGSRRENSRFSGPVTAAARRIGDRRADTRITSRRADGASGTSVRDGPSGESPTDGRAESQEEKPGDGRAETPKEKPGRWPGFSGCAACGAGVR
jgi:hypothetical protein